MKRSRFTEEQMIQAVREHDGGLKARDVCRKLGITEQTLYRWKQKFGGMDVSDAKKLKRPRGREPSPEDTGRRPDAG
jgi:putative transposase